ncbi:MAG: hypothetical protein AAGG01_03005 [Planctomycetota bacterium]
MLEFLVLRAVAVQMLREPLIWLCGASLILLWWGLEVFMPLGLSTGHLHRSTAHYELAYMGGVVAALIAVGPCLKLRPILHGRPHLRALAGDVIGLVGAAAAMGTLVLIPAEVFQLWQLADFSAGPALAALALGWIHLASMAAVIPLRLGRHGGGRIRDKVTGPAWIAFVTIVIPATQSGRTPISQGLLQLLDPGRLLRACLDGAPPGVGGWGLGCLVVGAWCLLALAVARLTSPPLH